MQTDHRHLRKNDFLFFNSLLKLFSERILNSRKEGPQYNKLSGKIIQLPGRQQQQQCPLPRQNTDIFIYHHGDTGWKCSDVFKIHSASSFLARGGSGGRESYTYRNVSVVQPKKGTQQHVRQGSRKVKSCSNRTIRPVIRDPDPPPPPPSTTMAETRIVLNHGTKDGRTARMTVSFSDMTLPRLGTRKGKDKLLPHPLVAVCDGITSISRFGAFPSWINLIFYNDSGFQLFFYYCTKT